MGRRGSPTHPPSPSRALLGMDSAANLLVGAERETKRWFNDILDAHLQDYLADLGKPSLQEQDRVAYIEAAHGALTQAPKGEPESRKIARTYFALNKANVLAALATKFDDDYKENPNFGPLFVGARGVDRQFFNELFEDAVDSMVQKKQDKATKKKRTDISDIDLEEGDREELKSNIKNALFAHYRKAARAALLQPFTDHVGDVMKLVDDEITDYLMAGHDANGFFQSDNSEAEYEDGATPSHASSDASSDANYGDPVENAVRQAIEATELGAGVTSAPDLMQQVMDQERKRLFFWASKEKTFEAVGWLSERDNQTFRQELGVGLAFWCQRGVTDAFFGVVKLTEDTADIIPVADTNPARGRATVISRPINLPITADFQRALLRVYDLAGGDISNPATSRYMQEAIVSVMRSGKHPVNAIEESAFFRRAVVAVIGVRRWLSVYTHDAGVYSVGHLYDQIRNKRGDAAVLSELQIALDKWLFLQLLSPDAQLPEGSSARKRKTTVLDRAEWVRLNKRPTELFDQAITEWDQNRRAQRIIAREDATFLAECGARDLRRSAEDMITLQERIARDLEELRRMAPSDERFA